MKRRLVLCFMLSSLSAFGQSSRVDLAGTLESYMEDYPDRAQLRHFLRTPTGRVELRGPVPLLPHGSQVRVQRGRRQSPTLLALDASSTVTVTTTANSPTQGPQSVLVLIVSFADKTSALTSPTAQATMTKAGAFYQENTYGAVSLSSTVAGPFTIAAPSTTCAASTWAAQADAKATAAGIPLSAYPRRVYAVPQTSACAWWGLGTVGGGTATIPSRAYINGSFQLQVVAHELGHNFGDYHSHSYPCSPTCTQVEYGDDRDIMGRFRAGHMTVFQKARLGWLPPVQTIQTTGDYTLAPLELSGAVNPKALRVLKATGAYYYLEYRTQVGFDANTIPGVVIHTGTDGSANSSRQVDVAPTTTSFVSTLGVGQTFADDAAGVSFQTVSTDATGAVVRITLVQK